MAITTEIALEILRASRDRRANTAEEVDAPTLAWHVDELAKVVHFDAARPEPRLGQAAKVWLDSSPAARRHAAKLDLQAHRAPPPDEP